MSRGLRSEVSGWCRHFDRLRTAGGGGCRAALSAAVLGAIVPLAATAEAVDGAAARSAAAPSKAAVDTAVRLAAAPNTAAVRLAAAPNTAAVEVAVEVAGTKSGATLSTAAAARALLRKAVQAAPIDGALTETELSLSDAVTADLARDPDLARAVVALGEALRDADGSLSSEMLQRTRATVSALTERSAALAPIQPIDSDDAALQRALQLERAGNRALLLELANDRAERAISLARRAELPLIDRSAVPVRIEELSQRVEELALLLADAASEQPASAAAISPVSLLANESPRRVLEGLRGVDLTATTVSPAGVLYVGAVYGQVLIVRSQPGSTTVSILPSAEPLRPLHANLDPDSGEVRVFAERLSRTAPLDKERLTKLRGGGKLSPLATIQRLQPTSLARVPQPSLRPMAATKGDPPAQVGQPLQSICQGPELQDGLSRRPTWGADASGARQFVQLNATEQGLMTIQFPPLSAGATPMPLDLTGRLGGHLPLLIRHSESIWVGLDREIPSSGNDDLSLLDWALPTSLPMQFTLAPDALGTAYTAGASSAADQFRLGRAVGGVVCISTSLVPAEGEPVPACVHHNRELMWALDALFLGSALEEVRSAVDLDNQVTDAWGP